MKSTLLGVDTRDVLRLLCRGWKIREQRDLSRYLFRVERRKDRKPKLITKRLMRPVFDKLIRNKLITTAKVHANVDGFEIGRTYRATVAACSI